jgi:hypothetical protein
LCVERSLYSCSCLKVSFCCRNVNMNVSHAHLSNQNCFVLVWKKLFQLIQYKTAWFKVYLRQVNYKSSREYAVSVKQLSLLIVLWSILCSLQIRWNLIHEKILETELHMETYNLELWKIQNLLQGKYYSTDITFKILLRKHVACLTFIYSQYGL